RHDPEKNSIFTFAAAAAKFATLSGMSDDLRKPGAARGVYSVRHIGWRARAMRLSWHGFGLGAAALRIRHGSRFLGPEPAPRAARPRAPECDPLSHRGRLSALQLSRAGRPADRFQYRSRARYLQRAVAHLHDSGPPLRHAP